MSPAPDRNRLLTLFGFFAAIDIHSLSLGTDLHFFAMLCHELRLLFRIALDQPELLAILIAFLDAHQLVAVDIAVVETSGIRCVGAVLDPVAIMFRLFNTIAVAHAISIMVLLAALDLGALRWTCLAAASLSVTACENSQRCKDERGSCQCKQCCNSSHDHSPFSSVRLCKRRGGMQVDQCRIGTFRRPSWCLQAYEHSCYDQQDQPTHLQEKKMANEGYHEPIEELSDETRDMHRAITSLMEELEAVDWYNQRVDACKDKELAAILAHNRDEEKEHAAMVLEWIRRRDPVFDHELKDFLFTDKEIAHE